MILLILIPANGCIPAGKQETYGVLDTGDKITIKVLYWDASVFEDNFGKYVMEAYPNVRCELVSTANGMNVEAEEYIRHS